MAAETDQTSGVISTDVDYQSSGADALLTHVYEGYKALTLSHLVSLTCTAGLRTMLDLWSNCLHCEAEKHNVEVRVSTVHVFPFILRLNVTSRTAQSLPLNI
jgi:hypothetical protein